MTIDKAYLPPPIPTAVDQPVDIRSMLVSEWTRDRLAMISAGTPRSRQLTAGASEIGFTCPRRHAYRLAHTPIVNLSDPLKVMFGTGMHSVIADGLANLDPTGGRYLLEWAVDYRGVPGHIDLFDRRTNRMIDWKTTAKAHVTKYRHDGPPRNYVVQAQIYAAGLAAQGERVDVIALVFIPRDGNLSDVWSWTTTPDRDIADKAIDRHDGIARALAEGKSPADIEAAPSNLCSYCPNYRPTATDATVACAGKDQQ